MESVAARIYFGEVFGPDFGRREKDWINGAINYGYAIMRASVARSLSFYGLLLPHGIHHKNTLNQFNLADDFMEPLRPIIDLFVANNNNENELLSKEDRENLTALLYADILIEGKHQAASRASEIMASSFASACRNNEPRLLRLPELLPISAHSYE